MVKRRGFVSGVVVGLASWAVLASAAVASDGNSRLDGERAPPWSAGSLKAGQVPAVYAAEWSKARNRGRCAVLAFAGAENEPGVKVRRANFQGGWAVAYDAPNARSAFGIAGSGWDAESPQAVLVFPNVIEWPDGSKASYGLEGGTGPGYLAYVLVAGQSCVYNVWSRRGQAHLEKLLSSLRLVGKD